MKRLTWLLLLLATVGCHKEDTSTGIAPVLNPELLYRTWQLTQVITDRQTTSPQEYAITTTFRRDGTFGGSQPGSIGYGCCEPVAFEFKNDIIKFIWLRSNPDCARINCIVSPLNTDIIWQIVALTENSLVLTAGKTRLEFTVNP